MVPVVPMESGWPPRTRHPLRPYKTRVPAYRACPSTTTIYHEKDGILGLARATRALNPASRPGIVLSGGCTHGAVQHASPRRTGDEACHPGPPDPPENHLGFVSVATRCRRLPRRSSRRLSVADVTLAMPCPEWGWGWPCREAWPVISAAISFWNRPFQAVASVSSDRILCGASGYTQAIRSARATSHVPMVE